MERIDPSFVTEQNLEGARDRLGDLKSLRVEAEALQAIVTRETEPVVLRALRQRIGPSEIAKLGGVSDSYVRSVRRKHGLPADPRYAHLKPAPRNAA